MGAREAAATGGDLRGGWMAANKDVANRVLAGGRLTLKRIAVSLLVLIVVLVMLAADGIGWLMLGNLKPIAEDYATELLGRPVTLESLTVKWGDPISIEAAGLKVTNADWASMPSFAAVEHISELLDPWSLTGGALKFPKMRLVNPVVVLERG